MQSITPSVIIESIIGQQPFLSSLASQGKAYQLQGNIKLGNQDFSLLLNTLLTSLQQFQASEAGKGTVLVPGDEGVINLLFKIGEPVDSSINPIIYSEENLKDIDHPLVSIDALLTEIIGAILNGAQLKGAGIESDTQVLGAANPEKITLQTILEQLKGAGFTDGKNENDVKGKEGLPVLTDILSDSSDTARGISYVSTEEENISYVGTKDKDKSSLLADSGKVDKSGTQGDTPSGSEKKGFLNNPDGISHAAKSERSALDKQVAQDIKAEVQSGKPEFQEPDSRQPDGLTHSVNHHQLSSSNSTSGKEGIREPFPVLENRFLHVSDVADKTAYITKDGGNLIVTLEPDALGKLNIHLSLDNGSVNVKINVANDSAKNLIENSIQQIIDSLANEGLSLGSLSVQLGNDRWNWDKASEKTFDNHELNPDEKGIGKVYSSHSSNLYDIKGLVSIFV